MVIKFEILLRLSGCENFSRPSANWPRAGNARMWWERVDKRLWECFIQYLRSTVQNALVFQVLVGFDPSLHKDKSKTRGFGTGRLFE